MPDRLIAGLLLCVLIQTSYALDSDAEQPATLEADDMEMDFATGVRTYRGNVTFTQGSIRMNCEELVTYLNDDHSLDKAVCTGGPARFRQQPQDQDEDIRASALEITVDQASETVVLKNRARVEQGASTITGKTITYNLSTEKATVKGGASQSTQSGTSSSTSGAEVEAEDNTRPSMVIQPRKKESE